MKHRNVGLVHTVPQADSSRHQSSRLVGVFSETSINSGWAMAIAKKQRKDDQLFNSQGLRHFRRSYSASELRWGLVVFLILVAIATWIV